MPKQDKNIFVKQPMSSIKNSGGGHAIRCVLLLSALSFFVACSEVSFAPKKLGSHGSETISLIYVAAAVPLGEDFSGVPDATQASSIDPKAAADRSFIAKIVRSDALLYLAQKGYKVVDSEQQDHDIRVSFFVFYQPDDWPFAARSIHLSAQVSDARGQDLLRAETVSTNWFGSLGDLWGLSGEQMIADATHRIVDLILSQP
jgi:hypothetical protein